MEFSFKIPEWLVTVVEQPVYIVVWAAFGVFFSALILAVIFSRAGKIFSAKIFDKIATVIVSTLMITWITGFVSMIILLFTGLSGIKMLLIWLSTFTGYFIFSIINYREIKRFSAEFTKFIK
ncbi:MAG: hypothetical protein LBR10_04495 [Prevotellaceae bacterium]|jgi:hypothetical protein|nr:hypothetical protein [Prevotellaceae bacterium]